jgi:hypothetical protein
MNQPELPTNASKLELRKALVQMRLELHRQQLRHETLLLAKPLQEAKHLSQQCTSLLGKHRTSVLGAAAVGVAALALVQRKQLGNWLTLGSALAPLLTQLLRRTRSQTDASVNTEANTHATTDKQAGS